MNNCLCEFLFKCVLVFVDDIIVWSPDLDSHKQDFVNVFSKLMEHSCHLKLSKCSFFQKRIEFLGFIIIEDGKISIDKSKLEAIANFAHPTNRKSLQRFLGMVGWYRRFICGFSSISGPLCELLKKDSEENATWEVHKHGTE